MVKLTPTSNRVDLLQGTLDLLILQTLQWGPQHGYSISTAIRAGSNEVLQVETGSLYPALHRLEKQGFVKASWEQAIKAWAQLLPQRDELERQLALIAGARVEIGLNVVGAVDILFGKKVSRLRKTYETGSFSIEGDRVLFTDPEGNVSPAA